MKRYLIEITDNDGEKTFEEFSDLANAYDAFRIYRKSVERGRCRSVRLMEIVAEYDSQKETAKARCGDE